MNIHQIDLSEINHWIEASMVNGEFLRLSERGRERFFTEHCDVIRKFETSNFMEEARNLFTDFYNGFDPTDNNAIEQIKEFDHRFRNTMGGFYLVSYSTLPIQYSRSIKSMEIEIARNLFNQYCEVIIDLVIKSTNHQLSESKSHYCYSPYPFCDKNYSALNKAFDFFRNWSPASNSGYITKKLYQQYKEEIKDMASAIGIDTREENEKLHDKIANIKDKILEVVVTILIIVLVAFIFSLIFN